MNQSQKKLKMTTEEYLKFERASETRHEYYDGEIFAMTGTKVNHNRIGSNINRFLGNQLADRACDVFLSDMRVKIQEVDKYTYPDVVIVCGDLELEDEKFDTLLNPIVIIEILSNSTELYDRGEKFAHYRLIPSLQEYILVSQYHCKVEKFIRGEDGIWRIFDPYTKIDTEIKLEAIDCRLLLSEIYHRVEFE
ncbi:Uma2 family endonuclease [uncultured Desulfobacter sp.]|uniref:Uma2 family endonuclease n=1 Tax=uncultured Desulfobacter sp. TaxID=240139 RepID=UPI0029C6B780|nr:Uma2 family endonuclease [uncultured Desulfobacter sp.]